MLYLTIKEKQMAITKIAKYFVTFSREDELEIAKRFEDVLKKENISANAKLKELIIAEIKKH